MIKILDSSLKRVAILKNVIDCNKFEEINGEKTLTFNAVLDEKVSEYVDENCIVEIDNDYFDIAYYQKNQDESGALTMQVQTEHISYRLNNEEYNKELFAATGTPTSVLNAILSGTGFTVGTVEYTDNITYSIQEAKSRRQMLMEFVVLLGGEVDFNKFAVSIVQHRGSASKKLLTKGKNIKVVNKTFNKREKDSNGNPLVSYVCTPIETEKTPLNLGDEVLLIQSELGIQESLRIVRLGYNPYNKIELSIELSNFISGLEDQFYKIENQAVSKDKLYYGARIGPEYGFESIRSDKKARAYFNADNFVMQSGDGSGTSWTNKLYFDAAQGKYIFDGTIYAASGVFSGLVSAATIVGGTITGSVIDGGTINGTIVNGGTINGGYINVTKGGAGLFMNDIDNLFLMGAVLFGGRYTGVHNFDSATVLGLENSGYATHAWVISYVNSQIGSAISNHIAAYHSGL